MAEVMVKYMQVTMKKNSYLSKYSPYATIHSS